MIVMRGARLTVLLVAVGLSASPVAGLYCDPQGQAAMACCQGDMSECNQPGKTEDCCQVAPTGQESAAIVGKAPDQRDPLDAVAQPALPAATLPPPAMHLSVSGLVTLQADPSPPRTPILRI
jgi:hypothetical protein